MADIAESSSIPSKDEKPVFVRVKRKPHQSPLEAFWLEINERPLKRQLLDLEKLSLSESSEKVEDLGIRKVFVQHVETVSTAEVPFDILQSFVPDSAGIFEPKSRVEERRQTFKADNQKHDQLLVKAKQDQEILSKNARFEQLWRSRKGKKDVMHDETLREMCHLYDVVRVDVEDPNHTINEVQKQKDEDLEEQRIMASYLPLLREFIPSAAEEIESNIHAYMSEQASMDGYVYDLYAVKNGVDITDEDAANSFPLVQVDKDDDFYDGPNESEFESDDSNAEDNPLNDYPDEESSEDEEAESSSSQDDESEEHESASAGSGPAEDEERRHKWSEDADLIEEEGSYGEDDYAYGDSDGSDDRGDDDDDWRWSYR